MSSKWDTIAIPLVSGLDTSYDESTTPVAKLRELVNGFFDKNGAITKRPGYEKFSDLDSASDFTVTGAAKALVARRGEVLKVSNDSLYSHLESKDRWSDVGTCVPMSITTQPVSVGTGQQVTADVAVNVGLTVYAWDDANDGVVIAIFDSSGRQINRFVADAAGSSPRCVWVAEYVHVVWYDGTANLDHVLISASNAATVDSGDVATFQATVEVDDWDVTQDPDGNFIYAIYKTPSAADDIVITKRNANGTEDSNTTTLIGDSGFKFPSIAVSDTYFVAAWVEDSSDIIFHTGTTAGSLGDSTFTESSVTYAHSASEIKNFAVGITSGHNWRIFWTENSTSDFETNSIKCLSGFANVNYFDLNDVETWQLNASIVGKPFTAPNGAIHVPVKAQSGALDMQNTCLLYEDNLVVGPTVFAPAVETFSTDAADNVLIGTFVNGVAADFDITTATHVPSTNKVGNTYSLAVAVKTQVNAVNDDKYGGVTIKHVTFDYDHKPQSVPTNDSTLIGSGLLYEYDGVNIVESGFVLWPELDVDWTSTSLGDHAGVTEGGSASSMTVGVYGYKFYYEWTNAQGQRQRSTAVPFSVTLAGSLTVTLTVPNLHHTLKQDNVTDVIIVGYRTEVDGSLYYRFTSPDPTATGDNSYYTNDVTTYDQAIADSMADADLIYNEIDPLTGGVLDHTLPLSAQWLAGTDRRIFGAGGNVPESVVHYSKLRRNEDPPEFFDGLNIQIDKKGGAITALGVLNENLVVFKNNHIFMVGGDGPNNNGFGDFNKPFEVATTVGCNNAHSVVLTPLGLIFQSDKGFYLLQKNYSVAYIGEPAEDFKNQVHTATVIPDDDLVVFLAESGSTVAYDFRRNQWSTYDNHAGVDSILVGDDYYYVNSAGDVLRRTPGSYSDAGSPYALKLKTAPLRFQSLQQYWRARRLSLLGRYHSDHDLNVRVWYDREPYFRDDVTYNISQFISGDAWGDRTVPFWRDESLGESDGTTFYKTEGDTSVQATAFSTQSAASDFTITRRASSQPSSLIFGVTATDSVVDTAQNDPTHSWLITDAVVIASESGSAVYSSLSPAETDVFEIVRTGTEVTYLVNSVVVYTSLVASSGEVFLLAALGGNPGNTTTIETFTGGVTEAEYTNVWGGDDVWGGSDTDYQIQHRFGRQKVQSVTVEIREKKPTQKGFSLSELALEYAFKSGLGRIGKTRKK